MRCRQGDLAIVVRSKDGNAGRIVRCVRLHSSITHDIDAIPFVQEQGPRWVIDPPLPVKTTIGRSVFLYTVPDANLRPIRGEPGKDETLMWAGSPRKAPA